MPKVYPPSPRLRVVAILALVTLGGCGGRDNLPPMGQVSGKVTYKGKPLATGMVVFSPLMGSEGQTGQLATGMLGKDGSYELSTFDDGDGAVLGEHLITVKAVEKVRTEKPNPKDTEQIRTPGPDGKLSYVFMKSLVPNKYANPNMSPLRFKVAPGQNQHDIELTD
ncbi:hypothetical protein [Singulisphaera sp. PoT]|uniref:hypothetical protein n=1 Tax=Singulisphaera sp. PoT TaxID=3411797 RepID=UPI003BF54745